MRAAALRALAAGVRRDSERLAELETRDTGKPIAESRVDMATCGDLFEYYAEIAPEILSEETLVIPDDDFSARVVPSAAGVVAAVTPWNYPLMQAVLKAAPALASGCAVLLKPSPLASLTCLELGKLSEEAGLPSGALTIVTGGPPDGSRGGAAHLISHPDVDFLSFTGSTRGGMEMLGASAQHARRTGLELGGKSAMLVFDDAELSSVVEWVQHGIFACAGQICSATSRVLVHSSVAPRLIEMLHAAAATVRMEDPLLPTTQMGAVISRAAKERILAQVERAHTLDGSTLLCGGGSAAAAVGSGLEGGYYIQPTILTDVPTGSSAWREEIFGPVLAIRTFETEEEAIALANDTPYGLAHAVMSADERRCERVTAQLLAGTVWVNCSQPIWPQTPFGGWKKSGFGKEFGAAGMHEYLRHKTVTKTVGGSSFSWPFQTDASAPESAPPPSPTPAANIDHYASGSTAAEMVSEADVASFQKDGVVCLRGVACDWIESLKRGLQRHKHSPSDRGRVWDEDEDGRLTMYDSQVWREVPEYRDFIEHGPMGSIAGKLMRSARVNFFFDATFVRSEGAQVRGRPLRALPYHRHPFPRKAVGRVPTPSIPSWPTRAVLPLWTDVIRWHAPMPHDCLRARAPPPQFRTPFHQDEPFWSVEGFDTCSAWMPLVPVERASALEFVAGSHMMGPYQQPNFGELVGDARDLVQYDSSFKPFPDVEAERHRSLDVLGWEMQPGDVVVFNGRMIHGGSGNLAPGRALEVFNTKWLGDDVRVCFRETGMDPDHSHIMRRAGLQPGDRIGTTLYPEIWRRP